MDTITKLAAGLQASTKVSNTLFTLVHSNATSTPSPLVSFHLFDNIDFGRVEDVVGNARFARFVFACFTQLGDDDFDAFGFQHGSQQQTDRTCAADQCDVACFRAAAYIGVVSDRQRFDQSGLIQRDFVGNRMHPTTFDGDFSDRPPPQPPKPIKFISLERW